MANARDNMNLLPDRERKEGEAAVKRAAQPAKPGEVKLSMPQTQKPAAPEKKSWWQRRKEKRAQKAAPVVSTPPAAMPVSAPLKPAAASVAAVTKPVPASKPVMPVAKPSMTAAPAASTKVQVAKPAPTPVKTEAAKPRPVEAAKPATTPLQKSAAVPKASATAPTPAKKMFDEKPANKLHEPDSVNGFLGPKVNLVPDDVAAQAEGIPWGLYGGIVVVVLGVWVALSGYAIARAHKAEAAVQEANARLSQVKAVIKDYETDKNAQLALQKQFLLVKDLIEGHVYWTPFLQKLEETTIPDVYYIGVSANQNGEVTLRAIAKNYSAAARQIRAFERASSFVEKIQVNQVRQELQKDSSLPVPVIAFDVQIKLVKGIFTISAPDQGAATTQTPTQP